MEPLYIETIKVLNGRVYNINQHNERFNRTRRAIYKSSRNIGLRQYISVPSKFKNGLVKCRITYGKDIEKIEFEKYCAKEIKSLQLVDGEKIDYRYKSAERSMLQQCYQKRGAADDIIVVKDGLLTDTYYGNIALLQKGKWYTPATPLLQGTMRAKLLKNNVIYSRKIPASDIHKYESISVFNALLPFKSIVLSTKQIFE